MGAAKARSEPEKAASNAFGAMQANLTGALESPRRMLEAQLAFGAEVIRFTSRRLAAQADFLASLCDCRTPDDLVEAQRRFWTKASKDYSVEAGELVANAQRGLAACAGAVRPGETRS